jgi:hypothetical protein
MTHAAWAHARPKLQHIESRYSRGELRAQVVWWPIDPCQITSQVHGRSPCPTATSPTSTFFPAQLGHDIWFWRWISTRTPARPILFLMLSYASCGFVR